MQVYGEFKLISESNEEIFVFRRSLQDETALVMLNFTDHSVELRMSADLQKACKLVISNYPDRIADLVIGPGKAVALDAYEGRIYIAS